ncbi:TPA: hypothetical protein DCE37_06350 [Candidatus Latescibacteria bacterium]|nr:hypothetical protein [Candidatus Latescibacterota bacterium]
MATTVRGGEWIGSLLVRYRRATVAVERMEMLMQDTPDGTLVQHGPIFLEGDAPQLRLPEWSESDTLEKIEVDGLTYTFPDSENGIADVSFAIARGLFTVVTGRIGSGKTTLLRRMLGLLPKQDGRIRWNGTTVDNPDDFFVPSRSAYILQIPGSLQRVAKRQPADGTARRERIQHRRRHCSRGDGG